MSERARIFLEEWTRDYLQAPDPEADGAALREALLKDAHRQGFGLAELEEEVGNVDQHLERAGRAGIGAAFRALGESGASDA